MQHASAVVRATHAGVAQAQHVAHACSEKFGRNRQVAPLRHAGRAHRTGVAQDQNRVFITIQRLVGHGFEHLGLVVKYQGPAPVFQQFLSGRAGFDDRAIGCQVPFQHSQGPCPTHRPVQRTNDLGVQHLRFGDVLRHGGAAHGEFVDGKKGGDDFHQRGETPGVIKILHQAVATGKQVGQHRHLLRHGIQVVQTQFNTQTPGHGNHMHRRIGGATQRHLHRQCILKGTPCDHTGRF